MILPDKVCGIEIKSDADTYVRLEKQVKNYDRYYDLNYIVAGSSHALHVEEHVPDYWGIITAEWLDDHVDLYLLREAKPNPKRKIQNKLGLLWKDEMSHILSMNQMPKYTNKSRKFIAEKLATRVEEKVLHSQISDELFERDYSKYLKETEITW